MTTDIVLHNPNQPDAFGYQVAFVKTKADGTEASYSATQYATEINVFESLFAKGCCLTMGVFDGGGLMETIALQPGDAVDVTLMKDEDSAKVVKRFYILNIGNVARAGNSSAKTYSISAITLPAFLNKKQKVYRGFKGKHSSMVDIICQEFLQLEEVEVEDTYGDFTLVSPGKQPFRLISQIMMHAISATNGEDGSLFFFYEDRDGFKFKTLNKIVADAKVHSYQVSIDKNVDGEPDLRKIQFFQQLKAGSQAERIQAGMYENEVVEFNHVDRSISNTLWKFKEAGDRIAVLAPNPVFDKVNNLAQWVNEQETKFRGLSNMVKVRSNDEAYDGVNNYGRKFGSMMAQKAAFNQIIYAVQIFGNTDIKAGDVLDITAPAMKMQSEGGDLDFSLQGRFLVGDVRHRMTNGEQFVTVLNLFKDGYETEYTSEANK